MTATTLADLGPHARFRRYLLRPVQLDDGQPRFCRSPLRSRRRRPGAASPVHGARPVGDRGRPSCVIGGEVRAQALVQFGLALDTMYIFFGMALGFARRLPDIRDEIFAGLRRSRRRAGRNPGRSPSRSSEAAGSGAETAWRCRRGRRLRPSRRDRPGGRGHGVGGAHVERVVASHHHRPGAIVSTTRRQRRCAVRERIDVEAATYSAGGRGAVRGGGRPRPAVVEAADQERERPAPVGEADAEPRQPLEHAAEVSAAMATVVSSG